MENAFFIELSDGSVYVATKDPKDDKDKVILDLFNQLNKK